MKQQILIANVPWTCFVLSSVGMTWMTFCIPVKKSLLPITNQDITGIMWKTLHLAHSTSHHKLMIKKGSITVTFIAAEQLLNTTWQFLHCKTRDVLTGAQVMRGCKCKRFSLSLGVCSSWRSLKTSEMWIQVTM